MELAASLNEISRRKQAFLTFLAGFFVGLLSASIFLNFSIPGSGYLMVVGAFLFIAGITFWFLAGLEKTRLRLNDERIERMDNKNIQSVLFSEIKKIEIKKRSNGKIREIYIWTYDKRRMFLSAFEENFEDIKNALVGRANDAMVKETREPIDFDHPLFYSILGILVGFLGVVFLKTMVSMDSLTMKIILSSFSDFALLLSMYFIFKKPSSARQADKNPIIDYLVGLVIFCGSIFMMFVVLNY